MLKEKLNKAQIRELLDGIPTSGNIEIRLIDPKRTGTITVREYTDKKRKFRPYVDDQGQHRVTKIQRTIYLNMNDDNDRLTYAQVLNHPLYIGGPSPVLKVFSFEEEADKYVELKDLEAEANSIIQKLEGEELKGFARILLIIVKPGSSDKVIKRNLYEMSVEKPQTIIDEWNDDLREIKGLIRKGLEVGKLFSNKNGRYTFQGSTIGTSFESAVEYIKENDEDLLTTIRRELS